MQIINLLIPWDWEKVKSVHFLKDEGEGKHSLVWRENWPVGGMDFADCDFSSHEHMTYENNFLQVCPGDHLYHLGYLLDSFRVFVKNADFWATSHSRWIIVSGVQESSIL